MTTKIKYGLKDLEKDFGKLTFGELLLSHRLGEEMSQVEMAEILELSKQALCDLEKGRKIPAPERAKKIALKLGMKPETFVRIAIQDKLNEIDLQFFVTLEKKSA